MHPKYSQEAALHVDGLQNLSIGKYGHLLRQNLPPIYWTNVHNNFMHELAMIAIIIMMET